MVSLSFSVFYLSIILYFWKKSKSFPSTFEISSLVLCIFTRGFCDFSGNLWDGAPLFGVFRTVVCENARFLHFSNIYFGYNHEKQSILFLNFLTYCRGQIWQYTLTIPKKCDIIGLRWMKVVQNGSQDQKSPHPWRNPIRERRRPLWRSVAPWKAVTT